MGGSAPAATYDQRVITADTGDIDPPSTPPTAPQIRPTAEVGASSALPPGPSAGTSPGTSAGTGPQPSPVLAVDDVDTSLASIQPETPAASAPNCMAAGALSIPAIHVEQPILSESQSFPSGLLCGNEDGTTEGVDILPGYASLTDSVAGGDRLLGRIPAVIFGHRNSHNRPFLNLPTLGTGDVVSVRLTDSPAISLRVATVVLLPLARATAFVLAPSPDGAPTVRLVACARLDGSPGGTLARWIVTLEPV